MLKHKRVSLRGASMLQRAHPRDIQPPDLMLMKNLYIARSDMIPTLRRDIVASSIEPPVILDYDDGYRPFVNSIFGIYGTESEVWFTTHFPYSKVSPSSFDFGLEELTAPSGATVTVSGNQCTFSANPDGSDAYWCQKNLLPGTIVEIEGEYRIVENARGTSVFDVDQDFGTNHSAKTARFYRNYSIDFAKNHALNPTFFLSNIIVSSPTLIDYDDSNKIAGPLVALATSTPLGFTANVDTIRMADGTESSVDISPATWPRARMGGQIGETAYINSVYNSAQAILSAPNAASGDLEFSAIGPAANYEIGDITRSAIYSGSTPYIYAVGQDTTGETAALLKIAPGGTYSDLAPDGVNTHTNTVMRGVAAIDYDSYVQLVVSGITDDGTEVGFISASENGGSSWSSFTKSGYSFNGVCSPRVYGSPIPAASVSVAFADSGKWMVHRADSPGSSFNWGEHSDTFGNINDGMICVFQHAQTGEDTGSSTLIFATAQGLEYSTYRKYDGDLGSNPYDSMSSMVASGFTDSGINWVGLNYIKEDSVSTASIADTKLLATGINGSSKPIIAEINFTENTPGTDTAAAIPTATALINGDDTLSILTGVTVNSWTLGRGFCTNYTDDDNYTCVIPFSNVTFSGQTNTGMIILTKTDGAVSWSTEKFVPISDDYRAMTASAVDGYVVLMNTVEWNDTDKKWEHFPRRVRWTAPATYNNFSSVGSGTGDLKGPGSILSSMTLNNRIVTIETAQIGAITSTGNRLSPFDYDIIRSGLKPISNPVSVDDVGYFVCEDGLLYQTDGLSVQAVGKSKFDLTKYADTETINYVRLGYTDLLQSLYVHVQDSNDLYLIELNTGSVSQLTVPDIDDDTDLPPKTVVAVTDGASNRFGISYEPHSDAKTVQRFAEFDYDNSPQGIDDPGGSLAAASYWYGEIQTGRLFPEPEGQKVPTRAVFVSTFCDDDADTRPDIMAWVKSIEDEQWWSNGDTNGTASVDSSGYAGGTGTAWSNTVAGGDDVTTVFTLPCIATQARVYIDTTLQVLNTDYTITDTNEITFTSAPASGTLVKVYWENSPHILVETGDYFESTDDFYRCTNFTDFDTCQVDRAPASGSYSVTHVPAKTLEQGEGETAIGVNKLLDGGMIRLVIVPRTTGDCDLTKVSGMTIRYEAPEGEEKKTEV